MGFGEHYRVRRTLIEALERDLVGPAHDDETIVDPPLTAYVAGTLYPRRSGEIDPSADIDTADESGDGVDRGADPPVALAHVRYPSTMGMTFAVAKDTTAGIRILARGARYEPIAVEPTEPTPDDGRSRHWRDAAPTRHWRRRVLDCRTVTIDASRPVSAERFEVADGLQLFVRVRSADDTGAIPITAVLLNTRVAAPRDGLGDTLAVFQVGLEVVADGMPAFVERPVSMLRGSDTDIESTRLLYRHAHEFAVGHGCSAIWEVAPDQPERATRIRTTYVPEHEVLVADSNRLIDIPSLSMLRVVDAPREMILDDFEVLCAGYASWIEDREAEVATVEPGLQPTAERHIRACREALARMRRGIGVLASDDDVWEAFRLANAAMLRQRARTVWMRGGRRPGGPIEDEEHKWYPFQLAFLLLCLEGIADRSSPNRDIADLLWFPTGGGKTEAYLGLIAFTTFLRRLRRTSDAGVTALMRYTLRLLTIQQFERAGLLICCCEELRRADPRLGTEPITIGLWVGQDATPNSLKDAEAALDRLRDGLTPEKGNPVQIHACPWCGAPLDHRNYRVQVGRDRRLEIACRRPECAFKSGLPIFVVDDDIYRHRPTLIISTVDKFAGLPWRDQSTRLFNIGSGARADSPPELIIQDELHLISGPLGTLTGLYETAIDYLCTDENGVRPKVIASTATIRRAEDQAGGLFERRMAQFPPPGLDARNSYFALEASRDDRGSRMYVGLMAPGTSHTSLLVRAYAVLLQTIQDVTAPDEVKDAYWSLVGYFNSLRVLGGATLQVQDDVKDRIELLARGSGTQPRPIDQRIELTSREPSTKIPKHLAHMAEKLPSPETLDVIFATNMISVGVDVDRLGLMVVMGQPQSTSEYIQSTSRVGRGRPGLVVVLFNAARSRDRSHYESFAAYHGALYRQVEASSVTPFSPRSRDRGLHGVLVALARMCIPGLRANEAASKVRDYETELQGIVRHIVGRVERVSQDEAAKTERQLQQLLEAWVARASEYPSLRYHDFRGIYPSLLVDPASEGVQVGDGVFPTLWSLRDVDRESNLYLVQ